MYLPPASATTWSWMEQLAEHTARILHILRQFIAELMKQLFNILGLIVPWLGRALAQPPEWIREVFFLIIEFVHTHIYFMHVLAWSIFFGPIIILVPSLLIHEILIIMAHNCTFFFHGLLLDNYEALRISMLDIRESLFSAVDRSSAVFNNWTSEHLPLMVFRLGGAVLGTVLLYAIWIGW